MISSQMTATAPCSVASGRFQAEKKTTILGTIWKQQRQQPDAEL